MLLNKERTNKIMDKYGLYALIATTVENVTYTSNFRSFAQPLLYGVNVFSLIPRSAEPALIIPFGEADLVADAGLPLIKDIRFYGKFFVNQPVREVTLTESQKRLDKILKESKPEKDAVDAFVKVIKEKGLETEKLGLDEKGIDHWTWKRVREELPSADLVKAYSILREIRMVKTDEEIKRLKRAAKITETAMDVALEMAEEGISESELVREFEKVEMEHGGIPVFTVIGCGVRSAFGNAKPTDYRLKQGDIIRLDCGCMYKDYYSDIAKVAVLGQPTEKQKRYYTAIVKGAEKAINAIRPGVKASELFSLAVETVRKEGIPHYERHHVGHGIGIELYDKPIISPEDETPLEENMIINIETPYYEIGFGGLQIEDTLVVTNKGFEYINIHDKKIPSV